MDETNDDHDAAQQRGGKRGITRRSLLRTTGVAAGGLLLGQPATAATSDRLFDNRFDSAPLGTYTPNSLDWDGHDIDGGGTQEHLTVTEQNGRRLLDADFPAGIDGAGNGNGGGDFQVDLGGVYDELYLAYRVKFDEGFEFSQPGGKLPGLIGTNSGGYAITGGDDPNGENGWSARMMWRDPEDPSDGGLVLFYVYHPDMPGEYGDNMYWDDGPDGQVYFKRGQWHTVQHRIVMNTPGENDGILEGWFDGQKAFERRDLRFRDISELGIDDLYFSCFFGGGQTEKWAHTREEHIYFDDFVVSTEPIDQDAISSDCGGDTSYPAWDSSIGYNEGDRVTYDDAIWEAQWFTEGETPSRERNTEWKYLCTVRDGSDSNSAPAASFTTSTTSPAPGETVDFDASGSSDSDGSISSYEWDFGDGTTATGQTASHSYASSGDYTVTLTVTDDDGATDSTSTTVSVSTDSGSCDVPAWDSDVAYSGGDRVSHDGYVWEANWWTRGDEPGTGGEYGPWDHVGQCDSGGSSNESPTASVSTSSTSVQTGDTVDFDASGSSDSDGSISSYDWDFGDGATAAGQTASHSYSSSGDYTVTLTVTDDDGATDSTSTTVSVSSANSAPTASFTTSTTSPAPDETVDFDASGSSDGDGSISSYEWDFGDGTTATGQTASHSYASSGDYTVTLTVTDDDGATDSTSTTVSVSSDSSGCTAAQWDATTLYAVGDRVQHPDSDGVNALWEAAIESRNAEPSRSSAYWDYVGDC